MRFLLILAVLVVAVVAQEQIDILTESIRGTLDNILEIIKDAVDKIPGNGAFKDRIKAVLDKMKDLHKLIGDKTREVVKEIVSKGSDFIKAILEKLGIGGGD